MDQPGRPLMRVRTLGGEDRAQAGEIWRALEATLPQPRLTCSWTWTSTWLEQWGDVVPHRFLVGERDGAACSIALVTEGVRARPAWLRPRTIHLGTAGEPHGETVWVERNGLLARPGEEASFAAALLEALRARRDWDRLQLDGFHPGDAALLAAHAPALRQEPEEAPLAELGGGFDGDVLTALSSNARRRVRQTLRAFGELELEWAADVPRALDILEELAGLHQERRTAAGERGAFASERFVAFHRALVERLGERAMLVRARREGETVGCLYGLVEGDRLLFYQSGLRRYEDNRLRAGVALHALAMRACAERGIATYDFLAPPDRYKRELATGSERLVWATLERRTARTAAYRAAAALGKAIRRSRAMSSRASSSISAP